MEVTNFYINIFLTQTQKNLGQFSLITNNEIIGDLIEFAPNLSRQSNTTNSPSISTTVTVTGLTSSRLEEVKTYNNTYKVGVNGVILASSTLVVYKIDDITYQTLLDGSDTTYYIVCLLYTSDAADE